MLANDICGTLRDALSPRSPAYAIYGDYLVSDRPRPLLLILDHVSDFTSPLMHASTYYALVDDLLVWHLNKVTVSVQGKRPGRTSQEDI